MVGKSLADSYLAAGFQCTKATAYVNASKLSSKPVVAAYIRYWMDRRDQESREKQMKKYEFTPKLRHGNLF
jgi:phage terminase small subunit